jgi:hypothetical protein
MPLDFLLGIMRETIRMRGGDSMRRKLLLHIAMHVLPRRK